MDAPTANLALSGPGHIIQQNNVKLSSEYAKRHERMQKRLDAEIQKQVFVKDGVKVPIIEKPDNNKDPVALLEKKLTEDIKKQNEALGIKSDLDLVPDKEKNTTYSYIRSQRAVELRVKDGFDQGVSEIQNEKFKLIKKLNETLLLLDEMNEEKRTLSTQLINQIKFVRQLQSNLGTSDNGHITEVIDKDLEAQFKREKHLGVQLKEKLKECEYEKERISEQLKFLEGQKDVVVVTKTGSAMDIETSTMSINEMLRYRDTIIKNLAEASKDVEILRIEEVNCIRTIDELHRKVQQTLQERTKAANQIQGLKLKFDDGTALIQRDAHDLRRELRFQKNLLAAKVIFNSINRATKFWKKANFQALAQQLRYDDQQIGSILAFRKLCLKYAYKRQEKYFNLWFSRGMRPLSLLKLNRFITHFQLKDEFVKKVFRIWNGQMVIQQKVVSRNKQKMERCVMAVMKFHDRARKWGLKIWWRNSLNLKFMAGKLAIFCRDRINFRIQQAFLKWNTAILNEDLVIRLKSQAIRAVSIQMKQNVFQGWLRVSKFLKKQRINLQIRTWNLLKSNSDRQKYKKRAFLLSLKNEASLSSLYLRASFDGLKQNWVDEKYGKVHLKLRGEVDPMVHGLTEGNQKKRKVMAYKRDHRHLQNVVTALGRRVQEVFDKWKFETQEQKRVLKYRLVLRAYRRYLKSAVDRWQKQVIKKLKQNKNANINSIEKSNLGMQSDIQKTAIAILHSIQSQNSKGQRLTKKVVYNLYLRYMKIRFNQWLSQINNFKTKGSALEKVLLVKMSRRIQRMYFKKYVQRTKEATWNLNSLRKSGDYHGFIKYNATKRMFLAFRKFVTNFITAKKCLKRAIMNKEMRTKKDFFALWHREHNFMVNSDRIKTQNSKVAEIQAKRRIEGDLANKNHDLTQIIDGLDSRFQNLGRKTLGKIIACFVRYQSYSSFTTWKQNLLVYKRYKQLIGNSVIQRLQNRALYQGFATWTKNLSIVKKQSLTQMVQQEIQGQNWETTTIEKVKEKRKVLVETRNRQLEVLKVEQNYNFQKVQNVIKQITYIENNFDKIKRRKHIFGLWKNYCYDKNRHCLRLESLMKKNARQIAFDAIRDRAWGIKCDNRLSKKMSKILWAWINIRMMKMFTKWKQACFFNVREKKGQMEVTLFHRIKNDGFAREKRQNGVVDSQYSVYHKKLLKDSIIALFDYKCKKLYDKKLHADMISKLWALQARLAVQKWKARSRKTLFCRYLARNYKSQKQQKLKSVCFFWLKKEFLLKSFMFKKILNAAIVLNLEQKRFAMNQIKQIAYQRKVSAINSKRNARDMFGKILRNWQDQITKKYFDNMKFKTLVNLQRIDVMKSIVKNQTVQRYRSCFIWWRDQTHKLRVVQDNHEHGRVRIQCNAILQNSENLKRLLIDTERYTQEEVAEILKKDDQAYKDTAEKVLCRLYVYSQSKRERGYVWLLAWCIDKLKKNVRDRKAYRFWMKYLEYRARPFDVKKAFDMLLIHKNSRKEPLSRLKYKHLVKIDRQNRDELGRLNSRMAENTRTVQDLKGQRDFLIGKMVSSQKLAIIRCNFSLRYAKEKAFKRLRDNAFSSEFKQLKYITDDNLGCMEDLKVRISFLENSNSILAQENDKLKQGAVNSIHLISTAEEIQADLELLSTELTQKAIMIRKLLEDNNTLNKRLQSIENAKRLRKQLIR